MIWHVEKRGRDRKRRGEKERERYGEGANIQIHVDLQRMKEIRKEREKFREIYRKKERWGIRIIQHSKPDFRVFIEWLKVAEPSCVKSC